VAIEVASNSMMTPAIVAVEYVSASWCKRCHELKPLMTTVCAVSGVKPTMIDYDALDDDDPVRAAVTSLPMIRMRINNGNWLLYTAAQFDDWTAKITEEAVTYGHLEF
jgi:hypothetical protein